MRVLLAAAILFTTGLCHADDVSAMTNAEINERIRELALKPETHEEQVKLVWVLMQRHLQGEREAYQYGRPISDRLRTENEFDPRARFAFGYFRLREGYATNDPFARKPRIDEGRRAMATALEMGGRAPDFLFDAGLALSNLQGEVNLFREAINSLTLARRGLGTNFELLPDARKADWHAAMAAAYVVACIVEPAREHYAYAAAVAPESPSGRKAIAWLRTNGRP